MISQNDNKAFLKEKPYKQTGDTAQLVLCLLCMHAALGAVPSTSWSACIPAISALWRYESSVTWQDYQKLRVILSYIDRPKPPGIDETPLSKKCLRLLPALVASKADCANVLLIYIVAYISCTFCVQASLSSCSKCHRSSRNRRCVSLKEVPLNSL